LTPKSSRMRVQPIRLRITGPDPDTIAPKTHSSKSGALDLSGRSRGTGHPRPGASDHRRASPDRALPIFPSYDERALPLAAGRSLCTKPRAPSGAPDGNSVTCYSCRPLLRPPGRTVRRLGRTVLVTGASATTGTNRDHACEPPLGNKLGRDQPVGTIYPSAPNDTRYARR